jgi:hypothetical protein
MRIDRASYRMWMGAGEPRAARERDVCRDAVLPSKMAFLLRTGKVQ